MFDSNTLDAILTLQALQRSDLDAQPCLKPRLQLLHLHIASLMPFASAQDHATTINSFNGPHVRPNPEREGVETPYLHKTSDPLPRCRAEASLRSLSSEQPEPRQSTLTQSPRPPDDIQATFVNKTLNALPHGARPSLRSLRAEQAQFATSIRKKRKPNRKPDARRLDWRSVYDCCIEKVRLYGDAYTEDVGRHDWELRRLLCAPAAIRDVVLEESSMIDPKILLAREFCGFLAWVGGEDLEKFGREYSIELDKLKQCSKKGAELDRYARQMTTKNLPKCHGFIDLIYSLSDKIQRLSHEAQNEFFKNCRQNHSIMELSRALTPGHNHCRELYHEYAITWVNAQHRTLMVQALMKNVSLNKDLRNHVPLEHFTAITDSIPRSDPDEYELHQDFLTTSGNSIRYRDPIGNERNQMIFTTEGNTVGYDYLMGNELHRMGYSAQHSHVLPSHLATQSNYSDLNGAGIESFPIKTFEGWMSMGTHDYQTPLMPTSCTLA